MPFDSNRDREPDEKQGKEDALAGSYQPEKADDLESYNKGYAEGIKEHLDEIKKLEGDKDGN